MKSPEYSARPIPEEVLREAGGMEKVPGLWHGMEYVHKQIYYPGWEDGLLVLRVYQTEEARELWDVWQGTGAMPEEVCEEYAVYIDVAKKEWAVRARDGRWGTSKLGSLWLYPEDGKLLHPETVRQIREFDTRDPLGAVSEWQDGIGRERLKKRQEQKDARTEAIMSQALPLPDAYLKWHEESAMKDSRYIIYRRGRGKEFPAFCTHCREHLHLPSVRCRHNAAGRCPSCGSRVTMKSHGMAKELRDTGWAEYVQAIRNGIMIRFVRMEKDYGEYGWPRRHISEPCRVVIEAGKKAVWYEAREANTAFGSAAAYQKNRIEGCARGGDFPRTDFFRGVYRRNLRAELKKGFPYHMFWEYRKQKGHTEKSRVGQFEVYDYFDTYSSIPALEPLQKTGCDQVVEYLCGVRSRHPEFNIKARSPHGFLGMTRQQFREIKDPSIAEVNVCRVLAGYGVTAGRAELQILMKRLSPHRAGNELGRVLKHTSFRRYFRYIAGKDKYEVRNYYYDYIEMGEMLGYDFRDRNVMFPRDVRQAHDTAVALIEEQRAKERLEAAGKMDRGIMRVYRKIHREFSYSDGNFTIRPARTNREIVAEGQKQHICVGNGVYARRMEKEASYVLFLRRAGAPEEPFYTVEVSPDHEVIQRHGKYNQEGEEVEEVDAFLQKFAEVKGNGKKHHAER